MDLPASRADVIESVADAMDLSPEQRAVACANGTMPEYADRIGWSLTYLKQAGAIANARRGHWDVTEEGRGIEFSEIEHRVAVARAEYIKSKQQSDDPPIANEDDELPEPDWQARLLKSHSARCRRKPLRHLSAALLRRRRLSTTVEVDRWLRRRRHRRHRHLSAVGPHLVPHRIPMQALPRVSGPRAVRDFRGSFVGRSERGIILTTGPSPPPPCEEAAEARRQSR